MLGYFPPNLPDEALYSMCARFKARWPGGSSDILAKRELFGVASSVSIRLPTRLQYLVDQLPPNVPLTVDSIIDHHTLAPVLRPFLTEHHMSELRERLSADTLPTKGRFPDQRQRLKYCAACAADDRKRLSEVYWHRLHQSSLVEVCPIHNCWLSFVSSVERPEETLVAAEDVIPRSQRVAKIELNNPRDQMSLWLSQQVKWLLDNPEIGISSVNLAGAYEQRLNEIGLVSTTRKLDYQSIREEFLHKIAPFVRDFEGPSATYLKSKRSLCLALRTSKESPRLHLHLLKFLEIDVSTLPGKNGQFHFEAGPWPCLNRACEFYRQSVITQYAIKTDHHGASVASFGCECGYTYSRQAPDEQGMTRHSPHKIVTTGPSWNALLSELWMRKKWTIPQIVEYLGISEFHVRKMREKLDLPYRMPNVTRFAVSPTFQRVEDHERRRREFRATVEMIRARDPGLSRVGIYKLAKPQMVWLQKHDREWLEMTLPKPGNWGPQLDWAARDAAIAGMVHIARQRLIEEDAISHIYRVSMSRLIKKLRIHEVNLGKGRLPRTLYALKRAEESSDEYKLRKLFWLIGHSENNSNLSIRRLLNDVGIRSTSSTRQPFVAAIQKAEALIMEKKLLARTGEVEGGALPDSVAA